MKYIFIVFAIHLAIHFVQGCREKPDPGPCNDFYPRFYYDVDLQNCKTFMYGGCGGNSNNYATKHKCLQQCRGRKRISDLPFSLCTYLPQDVDIFVDGILEISKLFFPEVIHLPPITELLTLTNGQLKKVSTITRMSSVDVVCDTNPTSITIEGEFGSDSLLATYDYHYQVLKMLTGTAEVTFGHFVIKIQITYADFGIMKSLKMEKLNFENVSDVHVKFSGEGSSILNDFATKYFESHKLAIFNGIENTLLTKINKELSKIVHKML